ncbi:MULTISPECIES: hypothetical protein [unclassified Enterococcus]|uniref:hypothetical protein n=1 Tax=unclassified Enterococcus TaxID=2608891 RepID=UPI0013EAC80C|nr:MULTISPECIES: hypothetical protein [unclassified Enterococcus]
MFFELFYLFLLHDPKIVELIRRNQEMKRIGVFYTYGTKHTQLVAQHLTQSSDDTFLFHPVQVASDNRLLELSANFDFFLTDLPIAQSKNWIIIDGFPSEVEKCFFDEFFKKSIFSDFFEKLDETPPSKKRNPDQQDHSF